MSIIHHKLNERLKELSNELTCISSSDTGCSSKKFTAIFKQLNVHTVPSFSGSLFLFWVAPVTIFIYNRFVRIWLGIVPTKWLNDFSCFFQCKPLHPPMAVDLSDSPARTYDVRFCIFGSSIAMAEYIIDSSVVANKQHLD